MRVRIPCKVVSLVAIATAALLLLLVSVATATVTSNITIPLAGAAVINPCNGETVTATSGELHLTATTSGPGATTADLHVNVNDIKAVGGTTGATYVSTESANAYTNGTSGSADFVFEFHLISKSTAAPSFVEHLTLHITFNANGTVTATVANVTSSCK